jgi:hypothetical protein
MICLVFVKQSLANRAQSRVDQCRNAIAMQPRVGELKQKLKRVWEEAAADKKLLEDKMKEEQRKNREADTLLMTVSIGKTNDP